MESTCSSSSIASSDNSADLNSLLISSIGTFSIYLQRISYVNGGRTDAKAHYYPDTTKKNKKNKEQMENELGFIFLQQGTTKQEFYNVDTNY